MQYCEEQEQMVTVKEGGTDLVVALNCDGNFAVLVDLAVDSNALVDMPTVAVDMLVDTLVGVAVDVLVPVAWDMLADVMQFAATSHLSSYLLLALQLDAAVQKSSDPFLELCQSTVVHSILVAAVVDAVAGAVAVGTWEPPMYE